MNLVSDLKLIDKIKKDMLDFRVDEDEAFEDVLELLIKDESFQILMKDESFKDLFDKGSIQALMEDKSFQSLIEKKRKEFCSKIKMNDSEQATLFDNYNSN